MSRISFFATRDELLEVLNEAEAMRSISYIEAGMSDVERRPDYRSAREIPKLGEPESQAGIDGSCFLIADTEVQFQLRIVPQRRGGVRYAMDQLENPDTISMRAGGGFDDVTMVGGEIATCTKSPLSLALIKLFRKLIRKKWVWIGSAYVSPEAERVLDTGGRLTTGQPPEYDLRR